MATIGASAKAKGSNFERKTAKWFGDWWGYEFHRTPASGALHWAEENNVAGDIVTPSSANFPFVIECKKHDEPPWTLENAMLNNLDIRQWWRQVVEDSLSVHRVPMLVFARKRSKVYIMVPYVDTLDKKLEEMDELYMITHVSFVDGRGHKNTFRVLIFIQDTLKEIPIPYWKALYKDGWELQSTTSKAPPKRKSTKDQMESILDQIVIKKENKK